LLLFFNLILEGPMMLKKLVTYGPALALLLAGMVAVSDLTIAQTRGKVSIEQFTAVSVNVTGAGTPLRISLMRWSTDAEREQLTAALSKDAEKEFPGALEKIPTLGYVWTSESAGYFVRYAWRAATADGGERIVIVTDKRLGNWDSRIWRPVAPVDFSYPYTVLELRLNRSGQGEGKGSVSARVTVDSEAKTIALQNYAAAAVVLKDVRRVTS
jgi:hypothetical protein